MRYRNKLLLIGQLVAFAVLNAIPSHAEDPTATTIKAAIEGTWALEEWNVDGSSMLPPDASGRLSLRDNVIMIHLSRTRFGRTESNYGFGRYEIDEASWGYVYERYVWVTETASQTSVDNELPWQGLREFPARAEGDKLIFEFDSGRAQIVISGNEFLYIERGALVRRWKRVLP
jgi:hypothetical protein